MIRTSATGIDLRTLTTALRESAAGINADVAAVELLVAHDSWLRRADFRGFVDYYPADEDDPAPRARIDWKRVADALSGASFAASASATRMLGIACSIAGCHPSPRGTAWELRDLIVGLDTTNTTIVLNSLARCAGWVADGRQALVDGLLGGAR